MSATLLGVTLLASACACSPTSAQLGAQDDTACRQAGAAAGTPDYDRCRQRLANARSASHTYSLVLLAGVLRNR
jgi:hypothetical protein